MIRIRMHNPGRRRRGAGGVRLRLQQRGRSRGEKRKELIDCVSEQQDLKCLSKDAQAPVPGVLMTRSNGGKNVRSEASKMRRRCPFV
ncbi:hypothetical protein LEMLEM_LOCUS3438 [Lemmus lemmus]